jgi:glycerol-3-phosphate dehydrogenase
MLKDALLKERILPGMPYTWAELQYVIQEEMAYTVKDILCSRWGTQLADWQQTLSLIEPVGDYLAQKYDWTTADKQKHIEQYRQEILKMQKAMHQ